LSATGKNAELTEIKNRIIAGISEVIKDGIPDSELIKAKRSLLGQFAFQNETFNGRANTYGFYDRISSADFGDTYIERIQTITNDDIKRVAMKYMAVEKANIMIIKSKD
jgi:predicted Zn-dependent peptidase